MIYKKQKTLVRLAYILFLFSLHVEANLFSVKKTIFPESVILNSGNIYYIIDNKRVQLTYNGKDHDPVLSHDKNIIAFARAGGPIIPPACEEYSNGDYKNADQIWTYNIKTKKSRLLISKKVTCNNLEKTIISINDIKFSPDDKIIYFQTTAWETTDAIHAININGNHEHFITDGFGIEVIPKGSYKGYLIITQHKYLIGGGSYDWAWLISPKGKEEGPLGEDVTKDQMDFLES